MNEEDLKRVLELEEEIKELEKKLIKTEEEIENAINGLKTAKKRLQLKQLDKEVIEGKKAKCELEKLKLETKKEDKKDNNDNNNNNNQQ